VYIAQLAPGVAVAAGSRGAGGGDFEANGQDAGQNNFIIDGVDNNSTSSDYLSGASYVVRPPPDALAEFKIATSSYSAEYGHSAGAVVSASIKSGTNNIHGDLWEYFRNDVLDARDFSALTIPKYRQNQFGATLGLPILRNKLFLFVDIEANRRVFGETATLTVPTPLMRQGNFSELSNVALTGQSKAIQLYTQGGTATIQCNGQNNVYCSSQLDPLAMSILNLYPLPNTNAGRTYNNYTVNRNSTDNRVSWDTRLDWNATNADQAFVRFSYVNEGSYRPPPLGVVLDGGGFSDDGTQNSFGEDFVGSETHVFNANLVNEFRFSYEYSHFADESPEANQNIAASVGLGGIPYVQGNAGLPLTAISNLSGFGVPGFYSARESRTPTSYWIT
jgi:hypothetical protein